MVEGEGELLLRPMGVMWFGSAPRFRRALNRRLNENKELRRLIVDLSSLGRLDLSGAYALKASLDAARTRGVSVALANIPPQLERIVGRVCADIPLLDPIALKRWPERRLATRKEEDKMLVSAKEMIRKAKQEIRTYSAEEAAKQIRERASLLVLDVREPNEHNLGVIEGAELVPRGLLESRISELCTSPEQDILIYCAGGNRAALATKTLNEMGYKNAACIDCAFIELQAAVEASA
jgi:rhodanese-related sulfurtransferase/anti-anti-sigma regulatory factor